MVMVTIKEDIDSIAKSTVEQEVIETLVYHDRFSLCF